MAELNILEAIRTAMDEELERDERVMVLGEDVGKKGGVFGATEGLWAKYGDKRVLDTPLTEGMIAGAAAWAPPSTACGRSPRCSSPTSSTRPSTRSCPRSAACAIGPTARSALPMVIRMPYGGGVHGALYHSQSNEAYFTSTVGLKVVAPGTPADAKGLLKAAVRDPDPVMFFEHKKTYRLFKAEVPDGDHGGPHRLRGGRPRRARTSRSSATATCAPARSRRPRRWPARTGSRPRSSTCARCARSTPPTVLASVAKHRQGAGRPRGEPIRRLRRRDRGRDREKGFEHLDGPVTRLAGPEVPGVPFHHVLEDWFMLGPARIVDAARQLAAY